MLLTELNTKVLLDVFSYLRPIDSLNLAETCVHLREVAKLHYKVNYKYSFCEDKRSAFKDLNSMKDIQRVLSHIGPYISDLIVDFKGFRYGIDLSQIIQKYCVNVKALQIEGYESECSKWIQNLKLENIRGNRNLLKEKVCHVTHNLKEMIIEFDDDDFDNIDDDIVAELYYVLEQNPNIESLHIPLTSQFNYEIFAKLQKLKDLGIDIRNIKDLAKLTPHLKMNELKKFYLDIWFVDNTETETNDLNGFLKILAQNSNLEQLSITMFDTIEESTLLALNLFKLDSLKLTAPLDHEYILWETQPNLTHLDLDLRCWTQCTLENIISIIGKLKKLKIFHIWMDPTDVMKEQLLDEEAIKNILQTSKDRPKLELRIHCREYDADHSQYFFRLQFFFKRCQYEIAKQEDSSVIRSLVSCRSCVACQRSI